MTEIRPTEPRDRASIMAEGNAEILEASRNVLRWFELLLEHNRTNMQDDLRPALLEQVAFRLELALVHLQIAELAYDHAGIPTRRREGLPRSILIDDALATTRRALDAFAARLPAPPPPVATDAR